MSRYVASLVYRKRAGSMARKAILAYCAERANDDGSGIWCSKVTISKEVECSKKTVIETFNDFVSEGILVPTGKRKVRNGFVHVYQINLGVVSALEDAISHEEITGVNLNPSPDVTPRGNVATPQEVTSGDPNRPRTVLEPSITPNPQEGADDLFSEIGEMVSKPNADDDLSHGFEEIWKAFPRKPNMPGKDVCKREYKRVLKKVSHSDLMRAVRAYAKSRENEDPKFHSRLSKWLRDGNYEGFLTGPEYRWNDLKPAQQTALANGRCPPSMLENGKPNAVAAHWLAKMRRAS